MQEIYIFPEYWTTGWAKPIKWFLIKETPKKYEIKSDYYKSNFMKSDLWKVLFLNRDECVLAIADFYNNKIKNSLEEINRCKKILEELN